MLLSFGFPRINYPGAGTVWFYDFHLHYYVAGKYDTLPPDRRQATTPGSPAAPHTGTG